MLAIALAGSLAAVPARAEQPDAALLVAPSLAAPKLAYLAADDAVAVTLPGDGPAPDARVAGLTGTGGPELQPAGAGEPYRLSNFGRQSHAAWRELAVLTAIVTVPRAIAVARHPSGFSFVSEGWFGKNRASAGSDKLMHGYEGYVFGDIIESAIRRRSSTPAGRQITAGILSFGLMTYAEMFDGFGKNHGFSHEDLVADFVGAGFSMVRNSIPGLREKIDYRLQYIPSDFDRFHPLTDYGGQKFLFALKLAGFEGLRETPLRLIEFHAGYFARGITSEERLRGDRVRRKPFVGIGLNVNELLFARTQSKAGRIARSVLDYVQVPYTAVNAD